MSNKIGIIGGLSPESTVSYYLHITRTYRQRFGDCSYPDIIIYSVNLEKYHDWRRQDRWDLVVEDLIFSAKKLEQAGADFVVIATNTMHKVFDAVAGAVDIPFINLIDETAVIARKMKLQNLGLLGTRYTMSDGFYQKRISKYGINTIVPEPKQQDLVHDIIIEELIRGILQPTSKEIYMDIINQLVRRGADGIILGCTEIPLLIKQNDLVLPLLNTAEIHADAALEFALR